jgi:hypothetical protein
MRRRSRWERRVLTAAFLPPLLLALAGCGEGAATPTPLPSVLESAGPATPTPTPAPSALATPIVAPTAAPTPAYSNLILYHKPPLPGQLNGQFWLARADGSGQRSLGAGRFAHWNSNGSGVEVVAVDGHCVPALTYYPTDGSAARSIPVAFKAGDDWFDWTPDGSRLSFFRYRSGKLAYPCAGPRRKVANPNAVLRDLYVLNADGTDLAVVAAKVPDLEPTAWTPDDSSIVMIRQSALGNAGPIVRIDIGTGQASTIVTAGTYFEVSVSPDGQFIGYTKYYAPTYSRVHVAGIDGSNDRDLGVAGARDQRLVWGGTDRHAALLRDAIQPDHSLVGHVFWFDPTAARAGFADVAADAETPGTALDWSPGDDSVAYVLASSGPPGTPGGPIVLVNLDGTGKAALPGTEGADWLAWQPMP